MSLYCEAIAAYTFTFTYQNPSRYYFFTFSSQFQAKLIEYQNTLQWANSPVLSLIWGVIDNNVDQNKCASIKNIK